MSTTLKKLLAPKRREILAETLEDRILYSAAPQVAVTAPPSVQIGATLPVKVSFVNASPTDTGFGPFVDVAIDHTGKDGATPNPAAPAVPGPFDGLSLTTPPTYLGAALNYSLLTLDDSANGGKGVIHPYATTNTGGPVYVSTTDPTSPYYSMLNGSFQDGDQLLVVELPFGSFTPNQPAAEIDFNLTLSNLADVGQPLAIKADGGFRYGNDPLNNPASDPSIIGTASAVTTNVDATLAQLTKTYLGPEDETATGPNYIRTYRIQADIAAGQTLQDMNLFDNIPSNEQFVGISGSNHAYTVVGSLPSTTTPGGNLQVQLTGNSTGSVYIDVDFYVPRTDASSSSVLNPSTGAPVIITNQSYGYANWTPLDPRDAVTRVGLEATVDPNTANPANPVPTVADNPAREMIEAQSLVVQKGFINLTRGGSDADAIQPGDVLVFTLDFQVSDYYAFQNLLITDTQTDGLHFDPSFTPTLSINGNTFAFPQTNFAAANYTTDFSHIGNDTNPATDGSTVLQFRISDQLVSLGRPDGKVLGGGVDPLTPTGSITNPLTGYNDGATTGQIIYQAKVLDKYTDTYPSGEPSLDPRDTVANTAITQGAVLTLAPGFAPTGSTATDDTGVTLKIAVDQVQKSIYAINGNTNLSLFMDNQGRVDVSAGDTVTYRLQYTLPSGDVEQLRFTDYLPLPVYSATQVVGPFNTTPSATAPAAGAAGYGPNNTLQTATNPGPAPTITTNSTANSVKFTLGDTINTTNNTLAIDILFTVTVQANPFADGLYLTNQVQSGEQNTQNPGVENEATTNAIVQIVLNEPVVTINKGVIAATTLTAPVVAGGLTFSDIMGNGFTGTLVGGANATAIGALNLTNPTTAPDAGDIVRYGLVVQNTGRADAFGVSFKDKVLGSYANNFADATTFAAGTNLKVYTGAGVLLTLGTDYTLTWDNTTKEFAVTLVDSSSTSGKLDRGFIAEAGSQSTSGANSVIVTYDLTVDTDADSASTATNTATLTNYQNSVAGPNFIPAGVTDTANVTFDKPDFNLVLTGTSVNNTGNNNFTQATIGELATYTMTVTVPEGTTEAASILNTLAPGLHFTDIIAVNTSPGVTVQNPPGTGSAPANVTVGNNPAGGFSNQLTFNLGNIVNSNTDNGTPETITIVYRAYVDNTNSIPSSPGNQAGTTLPDTATLTYNYHNDPTTGTLAGTPINSSATSIQVVEPALTVLKEVSKDGVTFQNSPTLGGFDAGDTVYYRITITNTGLPTAFDTLLNDALPAGLDAGTIVSVSGGGFSTSDFALTGNLLTTASPAGLDVAGGAVVTIVVSAPLSLTVNPTQVIVNNANVTWTSLNGVDPNERTGTGGPGTDAAVLNNYAAGSGTSNSIVNPIPQKAVISTSEAPVNDLVNVQVGEIVRYQLVWQIPEGTTPDLSYLDSLPTGLQFINDGTATVAFASNQGGITSTGTNAVTNGAAFLGSLNTIPVMGMVVAQLQGGQVTTSGNSVTFHLGNVVNSDSDADMEYVVVDFNALVTNVSTNQAGQALNNQFQVFTGASSLNISNVAPVVVREPNVAITKGVVATTGDAGDTVTYTVTLTNTGANAANAFNVHVQDNLPPALVGLNLGSVSVTLAGGATGLTDTSTGNNVILDIDSLPVNGTITITYTATLLTTVPAGQIITNTANATYTSLPGTAGSGLPVTVNDGTTTSTHTSTVTGAPGTATGERTGADGIGGALNDYALKASANVTVNQPTIDLQWQNGSLTADDTSVATSTGGDLVIGETGTFDILVTLPEGVTKNLAIKDILPPGYSLDSYQILTAAGSSSLLTSTFNGTVTTTPTQTGTGTVLFSFGDTTTTDDNVAGNNSFVIRVVGTLQNVASNQQGVTLNTDAKLDYTNPNNGTTAEVNDLNSTNNPQLVVKEPTVTINKSVAGPTNPDAGDTLTYTVTLSNTSGQEGYDVTFFDQISPLLTGATLVSVAATGGATATVGDFAITGATLATTGTADVDIPTGGSVTIIYTAQVVGTVLPGSSISNVANDKWSSINGAPAIERDGSGVTVDATHNAPSTLDQTSTAAPLNNYALSSSVITTTTGGIVISKAIVTTDLGGNDGVVTPGEIVTYKVTVTLPEGSSPNLQVLDALPAGMAYVPGSTTVDATGYVGALGGVTVSPNGSPQFGNGIDMLFDFGAITTTGDNVSTNNSFTFSYQAVVLDVAGNIGNGPQTTLSNTAQANAGVTGSPFGPSTPPVTVAVIEPKLILSSSILVNGAGTGPGDAGDPVTYTLNIKHNGAADPGQDSNATAYDLNLTDVIPAGLAPNSPTSFTVFQTGVGDISSNFQLIGNTLSKLPSSTINLNVGDQITVTIDGTFTSAVTPNTTYTNNSTLFYSSYPGDRTAPVFNPNPDVPSDHERVATLNSSVATTTPLGSITKTLMTTSAPETTGSNVTIGETVTYALTVKLPEGTTPSLTVQDILPLGLQYLSYTLDTTNFNGTAPTPTVTGGVASGDDVTYSFGPISVTGDNVTTNNSFVIFVTARVTDEAVNNGGHSLPTPVVAGNVLPNSASMVIPTFQPISTTPVVNIQVIEPKLEIDKSFGITAGNAGDVVPVTITIRNDGTSQAFDTVISDILDNNVFDLASFSASAPAGWTVSGVDPITHQVLFTDTNAGGLAVGATATITYNITLKQTLAPGAQISNTAQAITTTLPGGDPNERTEPVVSDTATLQATASVTMTKALISTSQTSTTANDLAIGEVGTFRLTATIQEGTTATVTFTDTIPTGLSYLAGTAVFRAVTTGATAVGFNSNTAYTNGSVIDASDLDYTGGVLTVRLKNVTIPATVANNTGDFAIEYNTRAVDIPTNIGNPSTTLTNSARVAADLNNDGDTTDPGEQTATVSDAVHIVEPKLTLTKDITPPTADAGDAVPITLVVHNSGTAAAFDTILTDPLPANFDPATIASIVAPAGWTSSVSGQNLIFTDTNSAGLAVNGTATFSFTVKLKDDTTPGITITNTAGVKTTTLPGLDPTERSEPEVDASDTVSVPSPLTIAKTVVSTSDLTNTSGNNLGIGESATFQVAATMEQGLTQVVTFRDVIPTGLTYQNSVIFRATTTGATAVGAGTNTVYSDGMTIAAGDITFAGGVLTVSLKNVQIPATTATTTGTIAIEYSAQVADIPANVNGHTLTNSATVAADRNGDGDSGDPSETTPPATQTLTVVEPTLTILKSFGPGTRDAGDTVPVTITITNTGGARAFDTVLTDTLNSAFFDLSSVSGITVPSGWSVNYSPTTGAFFIQDTNATGLAASGGAATFTFNVNLRSDLPTGTPVSNTATTHTTTQPGVVVGERTGPDVSSTANLTTLSSLTFTKALFNTSIGNDISTTVSVGEVNTYRLTTTLQQGFTDVVTVNDSLPATQLVFQPGSAIFRSAAGVTAVGANSNTAYADGSTILAADITYVPGTGALQFALKNVQVPATTANGTGAFSVEYQALVADVPANTGGATLTNTALVHADRNGDGDSADPSETSSPASQTVTIQTPALTIDKSFNIVTGDAGDIVTTTITITNSGTGTAYDTHLSDTIDGSVFNLASFNPTVFPAGWSLPYDPITGQFTPTDLTAGGLAAGASVTFTFAITLRTDLAPGAAVSNTASAFTTTAPGTPTGDRTTPTVNDSAALTVPAPLTFAKAVAATSLADTTGNTVAIGETVNYTLTTGLEEGVTRIVNVNDVLPAGLVYQSGTATFIATAGVSAVGATSGTTYMNGSTILASDLTYNAGSGAFQVRLVNVNIPATTASGTGTFTIGYTGLVANVPGNSGGVTLTNAASVDADRNADGDNVDTGEHATGSQTVTILEPDLAITKAFDVTTGDAGDPVQVTLTVTNNGNGTGYDSLVKDLLDPALFDITSYAAITTPAGWTPTYDNTTGALQYLNTNAAGLASGATVTFVFTVNLATTLPTGSSVTNTASIDTSTLPGGDPNERQEPTHTSSAVLTGDSSIGFGKTLVSTSSASTTGTDVAIGETANYQLQVTLNEGITKTVTLSDVLPSGPAGTLLYQSGTAIFHASTVGATAVGAVSNTTYAEGSVIDPADISYTSGTGALIISLKNVFIPATGTSGTGSFAVVYTALAVDQPENAAGVALTNTATVAADLNGDGDTADGGENQSAPPVTINVIEPLISVTKTFGVATANAGDTIPVTVTVTNNGTATAWDTKLTDTINNVFFDRTTVASIVDPAGWTHTYDSTTGLLTFTNTDPAGLVVGATATFTFNVDLQSALPPGATVTNTVFGVTTTLPGVDANERTEPTVQDTATLNASTSLTMTKTLDSTSLPDSATATTPEIAIGETAVYRLTITLGEGVTGLATFNDSLPTGLSYQSGTAIFRATTAGSTADGAISGAHYVDGSVIQASDITYNPATGAISFAFKNVTIPSSGTTGTGQFAVTYSVVADNILSNQDTVVLTNGATASADLNDDGDTDDVGETSAMQSVDLEIVEPVLSLTQTSQTIEPGGPRLGEPVTYTITLTNTGTSTAYDTSWLSQLPPGVTATSVSSVTLAGGATTDTAAAVHSGTNTVDGQFDIPVGGTVTIVFVGTASTNPADLGVTFTTTSTATYTSLPGGNTTTPDAGERTGADGPGDATTPLNNYAVGASDSLVIVAADLTVTKDDGLTTVVPGQTYTYTINVTNKATATAVGEGLVLTDTLLPDATLGTVQVNGTTVTPTISGSNFTVALADLGIGESATITVQVTLHSVVSATTESLTNTATIGQSGIDPTPEDNTASDTDVVDATPDLVVTKTPSVSTANAGDRISYNITVTNVGNQDAPLSTLTDTLDTNIVNFVSATLGGAYAGGIVNWNLGTIVGGGGVATASVTVQTVNPLPIGYTAINNTVHTTFDEASVGPDPTPGNNTATATVALPGAPDMRIVKTASTSQVSLNSQFTYTLTVTNVGQQNATGVTVTDTLPAGLTFLAADNGGVYNASTRQITWHIPGTFLGNGLQTAQLHTTVVVAAGADVSGGVANTGRVTDDGTNGADPHPEDNTSTVTIPAIGAGLNVTKTDGLTTVVPGQTVTYTMVVNNPGTGTATQVVFTDTLPPGATLGVVKVGDVVVTPTLTSTGFTLSLADIPSGGSTTVTAQVTMPTHAAVGQESVTNTVNVTHSVTDPTPGDNTATDTDVLNARPDLVVTKTPSVTATQQGGTISYTITVTNVGNQDASDVTLTDQLETALVDFLSASMGGTLNNGVVTWNLGTIAGAGGSATVTVNVTAHNPLNPGTQIDNTVIGKFNETTDGPDPTPTNNQDTATVVITPPLLTTPTGPVIPGQTAPDLVIVKTNSADIIGLGLNFTYTLSVTNIGTAPATGVTVIDYLPTNLTFISADNGGVYNPITRQITWVLPGTLPGGGVQTINLHINAQLSANVGLSTNGPLTNIATVSNDGSNGPEITLRNNASLVVTPVQLFSYNAFRNFATWSPFGNFHIPDDGWWHPTDTPYRAPMLTTTPMYSGAADPGSTLVVAIFNALGAQVGTQTVVVDAGGNWLATFPSTVLHDYPQTVTITERPAPLDNPDHSGFNLRTYFSPAINSSHFFYQDASVNTVFAESPDNIVESMYEGARNPVRVNGEKYRYEMISSQGTPAGY